MDFEQSSEGTALLALRHTEEAMPKLILVLSIFLESIFVVAGYAKEPEDYKGNFSTQALYDLCSTNDSASKEKCEIYIQGLMYGLMSGRVVLHGSLSICVPKMDIETARRRILEFVDGVTEHHPSNNKDGGDWIALMALAAGNVCKK
jgi:hypothetical protein